MTIERRPITTAPTDRGFSEYLNLLRIPKREIKNSLILDLGSGFNQQFSRDVKDKLPTSKVICLDPSLYLGTTYYPSDFEGDKNPQERRKRIENLSIAADGDALPFKQNSFDRVYALYSVPWQTYAEDTEKVLTNACKVLKTRGIFRAYPILDVQVYEVENVLQKIPDISFKFLQRRGDDTFVLKARKV